MKVQTYAPGTVIANRYQIAVPVGAGGMGMVYYAFDLSQGGLPIALKTFHSNLLSNRDARDSFLQEGRAWLELGRHPHVVEAYAIDRVEGRGEVFIAAELISPVEGKRNASLRQWIQPGGMPWEQAFLFGLQIVWGMQHAVKVHPGLVHRDLKPENVLVGADKLKELDVYRVRVTDFGLVAGLAKGATHATGADAEEPLIPGRSVHVAGIAGTPAYMAPEQWLEEGLDERTDIYAWGLIMAELMSGKTVAQGETAGELKLQHREGLRPTIPQHVPAKLRSLVEQCVAMEKASRLEGWEAVERGLRAVWQAERGIVLPGGGWRPEEDAVAARERQMCAYNTMGISYMDIGFYDEALRHFEQTLAIARELGDRVSEAAAIGNLGIVYGTTGQYERALEHHEQYLTISLQVGDRAGEGRTLSNIGSIYAQIGQYERALAHFEQALEIARELGDRAGEGDALGNLGVLYESTGKYESAQAFLEQDLAIARELGDRASEGATLGNLGTVYRDIGHYDQALLYYEQSQAIARELGDRAGEGHTLGNLGNVYMGTGQYERALAHFEQSLMIAREMGDRAGEAAALGNLGVVYRKTGQHERALAYLEQYLVTAIEMGDRAREGISLGNLGNVYVDTGQYERALVHYEQRLAIAHELGDRVAEGMTLGNLALLAARMGDLPAALDHAKESQSIFEQIGQPQYVQRGASLIAQIEQDMRQS